MNKGEINKHPIGIRGFYWISLALFSSIRDTNFDDSRDWAARVGVLKLVRKNTFYNWTA
ncbi:MAG: hypothetical protein Ct9H300mP20_20760 [Gammaproteobacteria bacterium]|nr:MAG: hypothetical protein Ct9H300mP20_20760 [Gammaproteobacteria bacterium]